MRITTLVAVFALACSTAQASEWVSVAASENKNARVEIDISSIRIEGSIRRAWFKVFLAPHTIKGAPPDDGKWISSQLTRDAFNCADELSREEALTFYFEDGSNTSVQPQAFPSPWDPVRPDTLMHEKLDFICSWKTK